MSDFLSIAAGLVGGINTGLEKRGERKRLEEARADEVRRFEAEMELKSQQFAMQKQLADSRLESDELVREQAQITIDRNRQELENVRPFEVERFNPVTGQTQTFTMTPEMMQTLDFEQFRQITQGTPIELADGTKLFASPQEAIALQDQKDRRLEFEQKSELDLVRTALQTSNPLTGEPLIKDPEIRDQLIGALGSIFRNRTPNVPFDQFGPPLASPDIPSPLPVGAGGRPEDPIEDTTLLPSSGISTLTARQLEEATQGGNDPSSLAARNELEALFRQQLFGGLSSGQGTGVRLPPLGVGARPTSSAGPAVAR